MKLTVKQKLFCKEYIIDFNATRAAKAAGYSKKTAFTIGVENLSKPLIRKTLAKEIHARSTRIERSADEVVERLWKFSDKDNKKYDGGKTANTKSTELLARHYGLLNDKFIVGIDQHALGIILSALPAEYADAVKKALDNHVANVK